MRAAFVYDGGWRLCERVDRHDLLGDCVWATYKAGGERRTVPVARSERRYWEPDATEMRYIRLPEGARTRFWWEG